MVPRLLVILIGAALLTTSAWAQLASQTALVGTVTDSGGLVVPGAQVVAVNAGTQDTYEAVTNAEGYFNIQFVRTGTYEITVTLTGFQTSKVSGVEVAPNTAMWIVDQHPGRTLTIFTCHPIGSSAERLVVHAELRTRPRPVTP